MTSKSLVSFYSLAFLTNLLYFFVLPTLLHRVYNTRLNLLALRPLSMSACIMSSSRSSFSGRVAGEVISTLLSGEPMFLGLSTSLMSTDFWTGSDIRMLLKCSYCMFFYCLARRLMDLSSYSLGSLRDRSDLLNDC